MWQYAVGLYLVHMGGGQLRLAAVLGFTCGGFVMLLGSLIGDWVDRNRRLTGMFHVTINGILSLCVCLCLSPF